MAYAWSVGVPPTCTALARAKNCCEAFMLERPDHEFILDGSLCLFDSFV